MSAKQKILEALNAKITTGLTKAQLIEVTGLKDSSVRGRLSELSFAGYVRKYGSDSYCITGAGSLKMPSRLDP